MVLHIWDVTTAQNAVPLEPSNGIQKELLRVNGLAQLVVLIIVSVDKRKLMERQIT